MISNSNPVENKRQFTRVPFVTQVTLIQGEQLWLGHVLDISFKGILVSSSTPFTFDETKPVNAEISFDNGTSMKIKAKQSHTNGKLFGFRFLEMDVDGMTHLRNIIMLNLGDDAACERELISLFSYHQ
jgi:hypothetical protein